MKIMMHIVVLFSAFISCTRIVHQSSRDYAAVSLFSLIPKVFVPMRARHEFWVRR